MLGESVYNATTSIFQENINNKMMPEDSGLGGITLASHFNKYKLRIKKAASVWSSKGSGAYLEVEH